MESRAERASNAALLALAVEADGAGEQWPPAARHYCNNMEAGPDLVEVVCHMSRALPMKWLRSMSADVPEDPPEGWDEAENGLWKDADENDPLCDVGVGCTRCLRPVVPEDVWCWDRDPQLCPNGYGGKVCDNPGCPNGHRCCDNHTPIGRWDYERFVERVRAPADDGVFNIVPVLFMAAFREHGCNVVELDEGVAARLSETQIPSDWQSTLDLPFDAFYVAARSLFDNSWMDQHETDEEGLGPDYWRETVGEGDGFYVAALPGGRFWLLKCSALSDAYAEVVDVAFLQDEPTYNPGREMLKCARAVINLVTLLASAADPAGRAAFPFRVSRATSTCGRDTLTTYRLAAAEPSA